MSISPIIPSSAASGTAPAGTTSRTASEQAEEALAARARGETSGADVFVNALGTLVSGLGDFLMSLLKALVGSHESPDEGRSEMPAGERAYSDANMRQDALSLLAALRNNPKMTTLGRSLAGKVEAPISPLAVPGTITSHFGHRDAPRDSHGHVIGSSEHKGIDIAASGNPTIHSAATGVVIRSETQRGAGGAMAGYGNWVEVADIRFDASGQPHFTGTTRRYAHLARKDVSVGTVLAQGDAVGVMGNTGNSGIGVHLHYEERKNNTPVAITIGNHVYAENDRSYRSSTVAPAAADRYASNHRGGDAYAALVKRDEYPQLPTGDAGNAPSSAAARARNRTRAAIAS